MSSTDISFVLQWWAVLFIIGAAFLPIAQLIFSSSQDRGYIFSKIIGIAIISYLAFVAGILHVSQFSQGEIVFILITCFVACSLFWKKKKDLPWKWIIFEEIVFFLGLYAWSFVRSTSPDIHGLEKYMDFGFINSILRSTYFPPTDMWYPPYPINYYYFGHLSTAVLTKLANIPSAITFNLMLATIFSFTFTGTFSIAVNLYCFIERGIASRRKILIIFIAGMVAAFLATFAGNLHTLYTFFKPYQNENPVPPWTLSFSPGTFPNQYWYPNATRFIYHTIHEFPIYSFVVSDLHGHVLDIPFVLLTIAVLFSFFAKFHVLKSQQAQKSNNENVEHFDSEHLLLKNWNVFRNLTSEMSYIFLIGFLLAVMYMTNAWDGLIYFLLSVLIIFFITQKDKNKKFPVKSLSISYITLALSYFIFAFPFSHFFNTSAIVHGIGVLCAPTFLTHIGKIGPFLFEADHCQKSPWWQLLTLYGFFYFWAITFIFFWLKSKKVKSVSDTFILLLIGLSTLLIIIPEFFYLKDIYPAHYRANTMFKLVYQSFIMLSLCAGYSIVRVLPKMKKNIFTAPYFLIGILLCILVAIYPYFAIMSYYGNVQTHYGLNGTDYLVRLYPDDAKAIAWINKHIPGQPMILEAQGDSYTDYARVSANTGLPTVLGWTVHEWLWRGSYDPLPARFNDIQQLYETTDIVLAKRIIAKYSMQLVFVGTLERQKYPQLHEEKFLQLGKLIYRSGQTAIYRIM